MRTTLSFASLFVFLLASPASLLAQDHHNPQSLRGLVAPLSSISTLNPVLTLSNREYRPILTSIEFLDSSGLPLALLDDFGTLEGLEARSFTLAAVAPEGTTAMRVQSDGEFQLSATYSMDGVSAETMLGDTRPGETAAGFHVPEAEDETMGSATYSKAGPGDSRQASACGNQTSSGNPFDCLNGGNCTWWAWKMVRDSWGVDFPARGNANMWAKAAIQARYRVLATPAPRTIGVSSTLHRDGHVIWITSVNGGTVCGTEMIWGSYGSRSTCYAASTFNLGYIHPPSIAVLSPSGGDFWISGQRKTVRWSYTGDVGALVRVELVYRNPLQNGDVVRLLAESVPVGSRGKGSLTVRVPSGLGVNTYASVRVTSKRDSRYTATSSAYFTLWSWF